MAYSPKKTKKLISKLKETGMPDFKGPKVPKKNEEEEDEEEETEDSLNRSSREY